MKRVIRSPMRYIQCKDEFAKLYDAASLLGKHGALAVVDAYVLDHYRSKIEQSFAGSQFSLHIHRFGGECSMTEVNTVLAATKEHGCDVLIGIGGGKTLDTAKAAAELSGHPFIIAPTAASSDAPCSALSVLYTDDGAFDKYLPLRHNPNIVLVDTTVVAAAPLRLLVSGMGDALATYYEARACHTSKAITNAGGICSLSALSLAKACLDSLFTYGIEAKNAVEKGEITEAVENIIETNIYLSGVGFESGGLAAAHAFHNGLTMLKECHAMLHGEKVAFGVLVQLVLEGASDDEIKKVLRFCTTLGLPTTLAQLGATNPSGDDLMRVAEASCAKDDTMGHLPRPVSPEDVFQAIKTADQIGLNGI